VVTRKQLLALGMPPETIRARLEAGRLHQLWAGVYAVGRPDVDRLGRLKAATLACGPDARLSHRSGAELWRIGREVPGAVDVSVPARSRPRRPGIRLHRGEEFGTTRLVRGIPVADPVSVLIDLAAELATEEAEDAVTRRTAST
jgi:hypothetical protein